MKTNNTYPLFSLADPPTSQEAAERHTASGARGAHCEAVYRLVLAHAAATAVEIWAMQTELDRHEVSRRLSDLMRAGRVRQGPQRKCMVKGTMMVVWIAEAAS